jgi:hypothetical protein
MPISLVAFRSTVYIVSLDCAWCPMGRFEVPRGTTVVYPLGFGGYYVIAVMLKISLTISGLRGLTYRISTRGYKVLAS